MSRIDLAPLMTDTEVQSNPTTQFPTGFAGDKASNFEQQQNATLNQIGFAPLFDSNTKGQAIDLNARDLNDLEGAGFATSGLYSARANCTNNPVAIDGLLLWLRGNINYQSQTWYGLDGRVYYRNKYAASTWSVWSQVQLGLHYGIASGTNAYSVAINGILALEAGVSVNIKFTNGSTGPSTLNVNALGAKTLQLYGGYPIENGTIGAGQIANCLYDGTNFILTDTFNLYELEEVATISGTNTYTGSATGFTPFGAYIFGSKLRCQFTNANTGASTLNINAVGAVPIKKNVSAALAASDILAGQFVELTYDGTNFQILGKI